MLPVELHGLHGQLAEHVNHHTSTRATAKRERIAMIHEQARELDAERVARSSERAASAVLSPPEPPGGGG